jgi:hypothetical protein
LSCDDALAAALDDGVTVPLAARAHVRRCARCRPAVQRHRALREGLRGLDAVAAPGEAARAEELFAAILAELDLVDRRATRRSRWLGAGAVAGAVAGGVAAGVVVARGRRLVTV